MGERARPPLRHLGDRARLRPRRVEFIAQPELVDQVLNRGASVAREKASATLARARKAVGLN